MTIVPALPELTVADIGLELAHHLAPQAASPAGPDLIRGLIAFMMEAPACSPVDALALVSWMSAFLPIAASQMPDDDDVTGGPKALVQTAAKMAQRAVAALEISTGIPGETFIGAPAHRN